MKIPRYKFDNFREKKRVLCPECEGKKESYTYNVLEDMDELITCPTCEGEGIVFKITETQYKKLTDAK